MERPVMNPMFVGDEGLPTTRPSLLRRLISLPRLLGRLLMADVFFWRKEARYALDDGSPWSRVLRGTAYRLLFVPLLVVLVVMGLVYIGTHPASLVSGIDPLSMGSYYDPVNFVSDDGTRLEGWFVPYIDARQVLAQKERILMSKQPAVVLVHDHGASRLQMLPLVRPLHDAGYAVLVIGLRGSSGGTRGSTFGLREADDIRAAVEMLRRRAGIDPNRIALLGVGTGANAAILAAERDPKISAVVLDHPVQTGETVVGTHLTPPQHWLQWLRPVCKWTFELAYGVDLSDLDMHRRSQTLASRPVLLFNAHSASASAFHRLGVSQTCDFLSRHLSVPSQAPVLSSAPPATE